MGESWYGADDAHARMPERGQVAGGRAAEPVAGRRGVTGAVTAVDPTRKSRYRRKNRHRTSLRVEIVRSLDDLRHDWTVLAAASSNVFATWEWASTWWNHYGRERPLAIAALTRPDGTVAGIVPMYRFASRPIAIGRLIGHGPADQQGPICAPADLPEVSRSIVAAVEAVKFTVALLERLPANLDWQGAMGGRRLSTEPSPVLSLTASTWDELLAGWSTKRRGKMRAIERRLAREHDHRYVLTTGAESLSADLDVVFELHRARWGRQSEFLAAEAFHRDFARTALERGWLRLWRLEIDGCPVAAHHGLRFVDAEYAYQAGREPGWEDYEVARALWLHTIRAALESGATEYRFLRGDEPYKMRFATHDHGIMSIGIGRGPAGRSIVTVADRLARSPVRRLLRGALDARKRA